jgi:hypothetical protein
MINIIKPNLRWNGSFSPLNLANLRYAVMHHMAHATWGYEDVHKYHRDSNKWIGAGYNYWIDFEGNIYELRGLNQGAHVSGYNSIALGIGFQGDFTRQQMTDAQVKAAGELLKWLFGKVGRKLEIVGHNDLAATACPGGNFRMADVKAAAEGGSVPAKQPNKPATPSKVVNFNHGGSVVNLLNHLNRPSSLEARKDLAVELGIVQNRSQFTGTAQQNARMIQLIESGALNNPSTTPSYVGRRVESIHNGQLRFYSRPSWNDRDVAGTVNRGIGFPTIVRKLKVGNGEQYEVRNSRGATYYITASPKYVRVV